MSYTTKSLENISNLPISYIQSKGVGYVGRDGHYTGRFIMFSVITNIYNKKTKGPTLMELFTATGKLKKFFF